MNAPRDLGQAHAELRTAELQADAAMHGETVAQAAIRRCRETLNKGRPRGGITGEKWRLITPELRQMLAAMATNRTDPEAVAVMPWEQLSADEKLSIGSLARDWRRQLDGAGWLR